MDIVTLNLSLLPLDLAPFTESAFFFVSFCVFLFQVAQYINFHFSLLESILQRLNEEEKKEIQRTIAK